MSVNSVSHMDTVHADTDVHTPTHTDTDKKGLLLLLCLSLQTEKYISILCSNQQFTLQTYQSKINYSTILLWRQSGDFYSIVGFQENILHITISSAAFTQGNRHPQCLYYYRFHYYYDLITAVQPTFI